MPFGGYKNFKICVARNKNKKNPNAYCAEIMRTVEGKQKMKHAKDHKKMMEEEKQKKGKKKSKGKKAKK